ncbi:MAG: pilus assembly protein PilM [Candidatus Doudnabacteria bacterium]
MFDIFEKKPHYIGLHINAHAIKALQFKLGRSRSEVKAYTNVPVPKGLIVNDEFTNIESMSELLKNALLKSQHGSFTTNQAIISLPESKSFIRVIPLQPMTDEEIENAIVFEAEAYIPMPMEQVYYDWKILSRTDKKIEVLLIASPKVFVDKFMAVIEGAGLKLIGVETEAQSIARALVPKEITEPILIVDLDAFKTAMILVENAALQFTSSVPIAGNVFTERLAKAAGIGVKEAEMIKRKYGFTNTVQYPNLKVELLPAIEDLAGEISKVLKFYYDHKKLILIKLY